MEGRTYAPSWVAVWNILSAMPALRELHVDLGAYLETKALSPEIEAEILHPLTAVRVTSKYIVKVPWTLTKEHDALNSPFRVERPVDKENTALGLQESLDCRGVYFLGESISSK